MSKYRMRRGAKFVEMGVVLSIVCCGAGGRLAEADNWQGSLRTKLQADNRYDESGDYTGEVWGQFAYTAPENRLNGRISVLSRWSTDIYRETQEVYQAYIEKRFDTLPITFKGGRFEKSDNLGLYLVDGGMVNYQFDAMPLAVEVYGGRPLRIDHVRSLRGSMVAGAEGILRLTPAWSLGPKFVQVNNLDFRAGVQAVERDGEQTFAGVIQDSVIVGNNPNNFDAEEGVLTPQQKAQISYRLNGSMRMAGHILSADKPAEAFIQGSYKMDNSRLENVLIDGWWDALKNLRLRNYFEAYRPRQPFVTFRDRFYSAYALGEQQVWRGSAEHKHNDKLRYSLGLQYANRDQGYSGYGFNSGVSYQWLPDVNLRGEFDYLELSSGENAKSLYLSGSHALNAKTRYGLNLAYRLENKELYGENQAAGIENQWQYMLQHNMIVELKASYIHNTALSSEYLGALQFTYYFDRFQPTKP